MDEDESLRASNLPMPVEDSRPVKVNPYNLLMRQSRKMGALATRTADLTREFLGSDVKRLSPDRIIFGRKMIPDRKAERQGSGMPNSSQPQQEELDSMIEQSNEVLAAAKTIILPSNLFPDSIILDRHKVTIIKRTFFWSNEIITVHIEDVLNVTASTGPLFGSITISSRVMNSTDHYEIDGFWRRDVLYLKEVIQGYMIAIHNNLDTASMSKQKLLDTLIQLGQDASL